MLIYKQADIHIYIYIHTYKNIQIKTYVHRRFVYKHQLFKRRIFFAFNYLNFLNTYKQLYLYTTCTYVLYFTATQIRAQIASGWKKNEFIYLLLNSAPSRLETSKAENKII